MGCENEHLVKTLRYGSDIYEVYNESLDFEEAADKCECPSIPSRTLALVKTEGAFRNLSQELSNMEKQPYWRIGLKKVGANYHWLDGEVLETRPDYMFPGSGECLTVYANKNNAFLRPLQCKGWASHSGVFGYICSYNNQTAPAKITATTPLPALRDGGDISHVSPFPTESNWQVIIWIALAFLFTCVVVLAILLLRRRHRSGLEKEPNSTVPVLGHDANTYNRENSVEFGQHGDNHEYEEEVGYATIEDMRSMSTDNSGPAKDIVYSEIVGEMNTTDLYAVVNKKKSLVNKSINEAKIEERTMYAVVDKGNK